MCLAQFGQNVDWVSFGKNNKQTNKQTKTKQNKAKQKQNNNNNYKTKQNKQKQKQKQKKNLFNVWNTKTW